MCVRGRGWPAGVLVLLYVRSELAPYVGEVVTDNVACGLYGVGGNKGATAISVTLHRRCGALFALLPQPAISSSFGLSLFRFVWACP